MDEDWTPQEKAEWQARRAAAAPGSQEAALLDDMRWTGIFVSATPASPVETPPAPQAMQQPAPPLPPVAPPFVSSTQSAVDSASQNAFWNEKRKITPEEVQAIKAAAPINQGIATLGTRRNVPNLSLPATGGRLKTRKSKKGGQIVTMFFNIRDQVKMYHWQTKSFSEHKATDELVGTLDTNIDKFVEVYMGRYGRPLIRKTLPVKNLTVTGIRTFITRSTNWLETSLPRMLKKTDSDLLNIRDEILGDLNQVKYLFTLV